MERTRLAVLISGGGRSLENLVERSRRDLEAEVVLAIASGPDVAGLARAARLGVPSQVIVGEGAAGPTRSRDLAARVFAACDAARADLVCLAGWLKLLAPIPERWRGRVVNIHPALLPAFGGKGYYGDRVHRAVLESGAKVTGCTVHLCDDEYDHGPILVQKTCSVLDDDTVATLAARVFELEREAYPEALRALREGRVRLEGRRARIRPA